MSFEIIGTLLGVIVQGLMLSIYGSSTACDQSLQSTEQIKAVDYDTQANATGKDKLVSLVVLSYWVLKFSTQFYFHFPERRLSNECCHTEYYLYFMLFDNILWNKRN